MKESETIIGHGDIASALIIREGDNKLYFASGVSNSKEDRESEYQREIDLLLSQDKSRHLVYFSSLCVFYSDTRYAKHKRQMEQLIKDNFDTHTIMRLGNITWGNNPNTLINYLKGRKETGEPLEIQDTQRYIIDREEFEHWIDMIPEWSCEMNVTGRRMTIQQIVDDLI
jgi:hypothetical protein